jgi:hypothetical protein
MRRLAPGRPVVLDLDEEAIDCRVVEAAGEQAVLEPVAAADAAYIPSLGRAAAIVFEGPGGRVRVTGAVNRGPGEGRLRFVAGGGEHLPPRRQAARVEAGLPIELRVLEPSADPAGEARRLRTSDVSIAGIGVRVGDWAPPEGEELAFELELPGTPRIAGTARVLRVSEGVAGLELVRVAPADRARLATFLIASRATG